MGSSLQQPTMRIGSQVWMKLSLSGGVKDAIPRAFSGAGFECFLSPCCCCWVGVAGVCQTVSQLEGLRDRRLV